MHGNSLHLIDWGISVNNQTYWISNDLSNTHTIKPRLVQFLGAIDPDLKRSATDGAIMSELKMYGRAVKNVRDGIVSVVSRPDIALRGIFTLGPDVIEAGLHFLGKDYYLPAQQRNKARVDGLVRLWNADSLTQREAEYTLGFRLMCIK